MDDTTGGITATDPPSQAIVENIEIPMPFVVIATPSASDWVSMPHHFAMVQLAGLLSQRGIGYAVIGTGGKLYLDLVRDTLASRFLAEFPQASDLFFIDDDVGFPPEKVIEFLVRPEPVLCGAYPKKADHPEGLDFPVRLLADESGTLIQNNGMLRIDRIGAGFMRVKRAALEALIATGNILKYRDPDSKALLWHFFSCGVAADGEGELTYWGEDAAFVQRCLGAGIEVWLDPNITFKHTGRKTWEGNILDELFRRGAVQHPEGIRPSNMVVVAPQTADARNDDPAPSETRIEAQAAPPRMALSGNGVAA